MSNVARRKADPPPYYSIYGIHDMFARGSLKLRHRVGGTEGWHSCRETFHREFNHNRDTGLFFGSDDARPIGKMLEWAEGVLNLKSSYRSVVYNCRKPKPKDRRGDTDCIYIDISPFWLAYKARSMFFTVLVRASQEIGETPLEKLMNTEYFEEAPRACALFLDGFTRPPKRDVSGWCESFGDPQDTRRLVVPTSKEDCKYFRRHSPKSRLTDDERKMLRDEVMRMEALEWANGTIVESDNYFGMYSTKQLALPESGKDIFVFRMLRRGK